MKEIGPSISLSPPERKGKKRKRKGVLLSFQKKGEEKPG